jgi:hypothetical protein
MTPHSKVLQVQFHRTSLSLPRGIVEEIHEIFGIWKYGEKSEISLTKPKIL